MNELSMETQRHSQTNEHYIRIFRPGNQGYPRRLNRNLGFGSIKNASLQFIQGQTTVYSVVLRALIQRYVNDTCMRVSES